MMLESLTNNTLLSGIAITLIHFLWQGVLVALVLKLLLSFVSYQKSQTRYALAAAAMLINLVLPLITFSIVYDLEYRQASSFIQALPLLENGFYLEQNQVNAWYSEWFEYLPSITLCWLSIVIFLTVKLLIELYSVNKLPLHGTIKADSQLQKRFEQLIEKMALSKNVELLLSSKIDIPMAIGWLKPVVLIPFSMISGLTPQQLDMLLLHELAHIRRNDYLVNFLQTLVETLLFFHPAVRWVSKQMRNEREYCSDDIAVQHGGSALAYAHTLADTASLCRKHRHHTTPSMAMAASGGDLKQRVLRLLDNQPHCAQSNDTGKWLASFTLLVVISFGVFQYFLALPTIGFQSNNNPLERPTSTVDKPSNAFIPAKNSNNEVVEHSLISNNIINNQISLPKTTKALTVNSIIDKKDLNSIDNANKTYQQNNVLPANANTVKLARNKNDNDGSVDNKTAAQGSITANKSIPTQKKSISALAFERTDSKNNTTELNNPYSDDIASLLNDPTEYNSPLTLNNHAKISKEKFTQVSKNSYDNLTGAKHHFAETDNDKTFFNSSFNTDTELAPTQRNAQLIESIEPKYPTTAKRNNIELELKVEFTIDKNGLVKNMQFENKSRAVYFRNTIRNAMKKWRFLPAQKNGVAVESNMSKIFSFSLVR